MLSSFPSNQYLQNEGPAWSFLAGCTRNYGSAFNQHRSPLQSKHGIEQLFMSEFNMLSKSAQAKALDDIYSGAWSELKENPSMIDKLLTDFEQQVERGQHPIYEIALTQDRSYVEDPAFRLKFLRANMHNVHKAVQQMISFLELKAKYFGTEKVAQDITLDDMTPDELKLILSGLYHIQEDTDRNGRTIFFILSNHLADCCYSQVRIYIRICRVFSRNNIVSLTTFPHQRSWPNSQIRVLYYTCFNILIPIHSVQKKGAVLIHYNVVKPEDQHSTNPRLSDVKCFADFTACLPLRSSACHICLDNREVVYNHPLRNAFIQALPKYTRERTRFHYGSAIELQHKLATYGIPQDSFPVDARGNLREDIPRNAWLYKHFSANEGSIASHFLSKSDDSFGEESSESDDLNSTSSSEDQNASQRPYSNMDVLFGRGYKIQNHPGNTAFREFLKDHQEKYDLAPRLLRRQIAGKLTRALMANGVRFWQKSSDGDGWIVTSFDQAEKRVGQAFRSFRKNST